MAQTEDKSEQPDLSTITGARGSAVPPFSSPMLATPSLKAFTKEGWIYEPKLDGIRAVAYVIDGKVEIYSRNGRKITAQYPALANALAKQCRGNVVLDGEIVALNSHGRPSFQLLQQRINLIKLTDIKRADEKIPVSFFVFDILFADGFSLLRCPLASRKAILAHYLQPGERARVLRYFDDDGISAYQASIELGFEGIVAKRVESHYEIGRRSPSWLKVKALRSAEFIIAGYSPGQGSRSAWFGSLILAYYDSDDKLTYAGSVGTGFDTKTLDALQNIMKSLETKKCPFAKRPPDKKDAIWLNPELVAEIKFMDWSADKHLRDPVFLHLRTDIEAKDVRIVEAISNVEMENLEHSRAREQAKFDAKKASEKIPQTKVVVSTSDSRQLQETEFHGPELKVQINAVLSQLSGKELKMTLRSAQHDIPLTNLNKVLFPAIDGYPAITKRDFLRLIANLSPLILTQLARHPLTMIRAPSGISAKSFFQKHWHLELPDFLETVQIKDEEPAKKDYLVCNNLQTLLFLAQHNIIEYHTFLSRCQPDMSHYNMPDFMVFDIDFHKESESAKDRLDREAFKKTREAANIINQTLKQLGLHSFLKTSGRNGLHIYIPLINDFDFEDVKSLSETISKHIEKEASKLISTNPVLARNQNKVFLDYHANSRGRSIAVPYTPRLTAQATISAPIEWNELNTIYPDEINQHNILNRLAVKGDIWRDIYEYRADLSSRFKR